MAARVADAAAAGRWRYRPWPPVGACVERTPPMCCMRAPGAGLHCTARCLLARSYTLLVHRCMPPCSIRMTACSDRVPVLLVLCASVTCGESAMQYASARRVACRRGPGRTRTGRRAISCSSTCCACQYSHHHTSYTFFLFIFYGCYYTRRRQNATPCVPNLQRRSSP